jgi:hypothetical protein
MLDKDYTGRVQSQTNCGGDPQGTWHQDEVVGGKPPVVKVTMNLTEVVVRQSPPGGGMGGGGASLLKAVA